MSLPADAVFATHGPRALYNRIAERLTAWIGDDLIALVARFGIAGVFWQSGRTKVEGWLTVSDNTVALFADEYRVPLCLPNSPRTSLRTPSTCSRSCLCWGC